MRSRLWSILFRRGNRHKGIGRALIQAAEGWAKEQGISELGSDTELENTGSKEAHKAWGFEETERAPGQRGAVA
jgi:aminoglycoside 6'-N-acetyltransferase I